MVTAATPLLHPAYLPLIVRPGQPDLIIAGIDLIPDQTSFTAGQPVEIRVTVRNIGTAPAGPFWIDLYFNPDRPPQINDLWHDRCTLHPCFGVVWGVTRTLQPGGGDHAEHCRRIRPAQNLLDGMAGKRHDDDLCPGG